MTKEQFVKICVMCGYASAKNARQYAEGKEVLIEDDLEKVHSANERLLDIKQGVTSYRRGKGKNISGDKLVDGLNDRPKPWNHIFDASRGKEAGTDA